MSIEDLLIPEVSIEVDHLTAEDPAIWVVPIIVVGRTTVLEQSIEVDRSIEAVQPALALLSIEVGRIIEAGPLIAEDRTRILEPFTVADR